MREFFKGWRRKAGCATLVMACVFAAEGIRSFWTQDEIILRGVQVVYSLSSANGWLRWEVERNKFLMTDHEAYPSDWSKSRPFEPKEKEVRQDERPIRVSRWITPYWSIVLPVTLFSAYLFLSKPRRNAPKTSSESKSNEAP